MSKLRSYWIFICHHKYVVAIILFVAIVGFLDSNSFYNIYLQREEISRLKSDIQDYKIRYRKDTRMLKELDANPQAMEKIARERYFMKKPNEEIFILVVDSSKIAKK